MSETPKAPIIFKEGMTQDEADKAWKLTTELQILHLYAISFERALQLYDFCSAKRSSIAENSRGLRELYPFSRSVPRPSEFWDSMHKLNEEQRMVTEWMFIAARDAAISLYNFGCKMEYIKGNSYVFNTFGSDILWEHSKAAGRLMNENFHRFEIVRHCVAHSALFSSKIDDHAIKSGSSTQYIGGSLFGRRLTYTYNDNGSAKIFYYELSAESLAKIHQIEAEFYLAFANISSCLSKPVANDRGNSS